MTPTPMNPLTSAVPTPFQPRVTVIFCTYNQVQFVNEAVESILNQTYPNLEIILLDNGSSDGTSEVLKKFAENPKVRLMLHSQNGPVTQRLNHAVANSTGEFISLLYGDDLYLPQKIEAQVKCFSSLDESYGVVYSPGYRLNVLSGKKWEEPSLRCSGSILEEMLQTPFSAGFINPVSPLMRRQCFIDYPYDETVFIEGDFILFRFAMSYRFRFHNEPLVIMREHASNAGKALKRNMEVVSILYPRLAREPHFQTKYQKALGVSAGRYFRSFGWQGIRVMEEQAWARRCLLTALSWNRRLARDPKVLSGLFLSFLPKFILKFINSVANRITQNKQVNLYRESYA